MKFSCTGQLMGIEEGQKGYYTVKILQDEYIQKVSIKDEKSINILKCAQRMDDVFFDGCRDFPHVNDGRAWISYSATTARVAQLDEEGRRIAK